MKRKATTFDKTKVEEYGGMIIFSFYFMEPYVWIMLTSLKSRAEVNSYPPTLLPKTWNWQNFSDAWNSQPFTRYLWNTVFITVTTTLGQVISCSLAAFGFARYDFKFKNALFLLLLSTMMLPWDVTAIPQYMLFNRLGWINTLNPLIIPGLFGSAYNIFLLRQFLLNFPRDIENAARIDGASEFQIYSRIFLPAMKGPLFLIGVLNILIVWND